MSMFDSLTRTFVELMNTPLVPPEAPRDVPLTDFPCGSSFPGSSSPSSPRFSTSSASSTGPAAGVGSRAHEYGRYCHGRTGRERESRRWSNDSSDQEQEPGNYLRESTDVEAMPAYSIQNGRDA